MASSVGTAAHASAAGGGGRMDVGRTLRGWMLLVAVGGAALTLDGACAALALAAFGAPGPAILAAAFNLGAALRFAVTLLPGREPLISRFGRFEAAGLPDRDGAYTRRLTQAWMAVLGGFAAAFAAAAALSWPVALFSAAELAVCALLFLGEHALRNHLFPHHGRATPARTLMAIRLACRGAPPGP
jgi:uncharacterized membrane protein